MITLAPDPSVLDFLMVCQELREDEQRQIEASTGEPYDFKKVVAMMCNTPQPRWVVLEDGKPIALIGYTQRRPGVWRDWMMSTDAVWKKPIAITRICRQIMETMEANGAHRLECVSMATRVMAHKWYRSVGLKFEGILRSWGAHGEDAMMFARVKAPVGE